MYLSCLFVFVFLLFFLLLFCFGHKKIPRCKYAKNTHLQHRWSRGRSKERGYHAHVHAHHDGEAHDSDGTDYAADNSSDHSSSATHSPRHRPLPYGDSPLARTHLKKIDKRDSLSSQNDPANSDTVRSSITIAQVHTPCHMPHINHAFKRAVA